MALYIAHSIFRLARLLYVTPETLGPYYVYFIHSVCTVITMRITKFSCMNLILSKVMFIRTAVSAMFRGSLTFRVYIFVTWLVNVISILSYLLHGTESFLRSCLVLQLIRKFRTFYGTPKFITILTSARHLFLSLANSIQSAQPLPTSSRSILILSSHLCLGLPNGLFPSGFPTKTLCTPLPSSIRAT